MDYIETILGVKVQYQPWAREKELPYYLLDRYHFRQSTIGTVRTIFIYPKTELEQIASLKKQIARIQKLEFLPVVIVIQNISRSRREYMISANIPFVVPNKQLYLPFMGIALQEKFEADPTPIVHLQPSAQVLFFYYLYQKKTQIYAAEAAKSLNFSRMTITRAFRQLEYTELFHTKKEGVQKILLGKYAEKTLFNKMKPYLFSPIRKTIYMAKPLNMPGLSVAGLSALSKKSRIIPPDLACYAVNGAAVGLKGTDTLVDAAAQAEVQLWKYDPTILDKSGIVDSFSLAMTLKDKPDERVESAVEEMLNDIWRD